MKMKSQQTTAKRIFTDFSFLCDVIDRDEKNRETGQRDKFWRDGIKHKTDYVKFLTFYVSLNECDDFKVDIKFTLWKTYSDVCCCFSQTLLYANLVGEEIITYYDDSIV